MEIFVIMTVRKSRGDATETITWTATLTPGPAIDRAGLFGYVLANLLPEQYRGGVVLFYSAEPLQFADRGPVPSPAVAGG
jgi:hypothetical protein